MIGTGRISAVLCSTDLERSREFYEQKVGLTLSPETIPNHLLFDGGNGSSLLVYGRPSENKGDHTQVRFWSNDVEADVAVAPGARRGLRGLRLPGAEDGRPRRDDAGIGKSAWFKDPDGNTLALFQPE